VLDLMMPVMSGWQFCEERKADPMIARIPVVVMTAARHAAGRPVDLAVTEILEKPLDIDEVIETVAQWCRPISAVPTDASP
jgi:CheY-like chemotaxis protein